MEKHHFSLRKKSWLSNFCRLKLLDLRNNSYFLLEHIHSSPGIWCEVLSGAKLDGHLIWCGNGCFNMSHLLSARHVKEKRGPDHSQWKDKHFVPLHPAPSYKSKNTDHFDQRQREERSWIIQAAEEPSVWVSSENELFIEGCHCNM